MSASIPDNEWAERVFVLRDGNTLKSETKYCSFCTSWHQRGGGVIHKDLVASVRLAEEAPTPVEQLPAETFFA